MAGTSWLFDPRQNEASFETTKNYEVFFKEKKNEVHALAWVIEKFTKKNILRFEITTGVGNFRRIYLPSALYYQKSGCSAMFWMQSLL